MGNANITLAILTEDWQTYQSELSKALAPLSSEQLALRAAPHLRSIGELARHMIAARAEMVNDAKSSSFCLEMWNWSNPGESTSAEVVPCFPGSEQAVRQVRS